MNAKSTTIPRQPEPEPALPRENWDGLDWSHLVWQAGQKNLVLLLRHALMVRSVWRETAPQRAHLKLFSLGWGFGRSLLTKDRTMTPATTIPKIASGDIYLSTPNVKLRGAPGTNPERSHWALIKNKPAKPPWTARPFERHVRTRPRTWSHPRAKTLQRATGLEPTTRPQLASRWTRRPEGRLKNHRPCRPPASVTQTDSDFSSPCPPSNQPAWQTGKPKTQNPPANTETGKDSTTDNYHT